MRKILILAMAALLVVAFAVSSFPAETTLSGDFRVRSVMDFNADKTVTQPLGPAFGNIPDKDLTTSYFEQRLRLTITHTRSEFLKAVVTLDLAEDIWGQERAMYMNYDAGTGKLIHEAYIEALTPIGLFTVGAKDSKVGFGLWSDSGGDGCNTGASWVVKFGDVVAGLAYTKYMDYIRNWPGTIAWTGVAAFTPTGGPGSSLYNSDFDALSLFTIYMTDKYTAGLYVGLYNLPRTVGTALFAKGLVGFGGFAGERPDWQVLVYNNWPTPPTVPFGHGIGIGTGRMGMYKSKLMDVTTFWNLKFLDDMLVFKGEVDWIYGKGDIHNTGKDYNTALFGLGATRFLPDEVTLGGLNIYADLSFNYDIFTVGVAFLYGSGEKEYNGIEQHHFNLNTTGLGDFSWSNIIVSGNSVFLNPMYNAFGTSTFPLGLGDNQENVTSVKVYWSVCPSEKLDIHGAFIWAKYTEEVGRIPPVAAMAAFGLAAYGVDGPQPFYSHPMNYAGGNVNAGFGYISPGYSDDLGWEIDFGLTYEIMEGLSFNTEFGVLFTGDAFDYVDVTTGRTHDWGEIYRWVNTLTYEF